MLKKVKTFTARTETITWFDLIRKSAELKRNMKDSLE